MGNWEAGSVRVGKYIVGLNKNSVIQTLTRPGPPHNQKFHKLFHCAHKRLLRGQRFSLSLINWSQGVRLSGVVIDNPGAPCHQKYHKLFYCTLMNVGKGVNVSQFHLLIGQRG